MASKWVEVNIHLNDHSYSVTNNVLREFVAPCVQECKAKHRISSWHFFREPAIRLRLFGEAGEIDKIKEELHSRLSQLEIAQPQIYKTHLFGAHGEEGKEYQGEAEIWGSDWPIAMEFVHCSAETALQFVILEKPHMQRDFHADRYVHLLLNQLGFDHLEEEAFHNIRGTAGSYFARLISHVIQQTNEIKTKLTDMESRIDRQSP